MLSALLFGLALVVALANSRLAGVAPAAGLAAYERLMPGTPIAALAAFECVPTHAMVSGITRQCLIEGLPDLDWILVTTSQGVITHLAASPNAMTLGELILRWGRPGRVRPMGIRNGERLYALEWGPALMAMARCSGYLTPRCAAAFIQGQNHVK